MAIPSSSSGVPLSSDRTSVTSFMSFTVFLDRPDGPVFLLARPELTPLEMFAPRPPNSSLETDRTLAMSTVSESVHVSFQLIRNFLASATMSKWSINSVSAKRSVLPFLRSSFKSPSKSCQTAVPDFPDTDTPKC